MMAKNPTKTLSRRVLVLIKRDITSTVSRVVWQHEVPLLEIVHGEGNVTQPDPATMDEGFRARPSKDLVIYKTPEGQENFRPPTEVARIGWVFHGDPRAEYERLEALYGKKADKDELVIESVYGRFQTGNFERMVGGAGPEDMPESQLRSLIVEQGLVPDSTKDSTKDEKADIALLRQAFAAKTRDQLVAMIEEEGVLA
jgi:hypothetical protein